MTKTEEEPLKRRKENKMKGKDHSTVEMQKETIMHGQLRLFKTTESLPKPKVDTGKETNDGKTTMEPGSSATKEGKST